MCDFFYFQRPMAVADISIFVPTDLEVMSQNLKFAAVVVAKLSVPLQLALVPHLPVPQFADGRPTKVTGNVHVRTP